MNYLLTPAQRRVLLTLDPNGEATQINDLDALVLRSLMKSGLLELDQCLHLPTGRLEAGYYAALTDEGVHVQQNARIRHERNTSVLQQAGLQHASNGGTEQPVVQEAR